MVRTFKSRTSVASQISKWYVLRYGKQFKVACITPEGAYKLQERGWQLGERVSDSRQEAEQHRVELQDRARKFRERQKMLVWELAPVLKSILPESGSMSDDQGPKSSSSSHQFHVALGYSVFNGFNLN